MNEDCKKTFNFIFDKYNLGSIKSKLERNNHIYDYKIINEIDSFINKLNDYKYPNFEIKDETIYLSTNLVSFLKKNDYSIDHVVSMNKIYDLILNLVERFNFMKIRNLNDDIYYELKHISNYNFNQRKNLIITFIRKNSSNNRINIQI